MKRQTKQGVMDLNFLPGKKNRRYDDLAEELAANQNVAQESSEKPQRVDRKK